MEVLWAIGYSTGFLQSMFGAILKGITVFDMNSLNMCKKGVL